MYRFSTKHLVSTKWQFLTLTVTKLKNWSHILGCWVIYRIIVNGYNRKTSSKRHGGIPFLWISSNFLAFCLAGRHSLTYIHTYIARIHGHLDAWHTYIHAYIYPMCKCTYVVRYTYIYIEHDSYHGIYYTYIYTYRYTYLGIYYICIHLHIQHDTYQGTYFICIHINQMLCIPLFMGIRAFSLQTCRNTIQMPKCLKSNKKGI